MICSPAHSYREMSGLEEGVKIIRTSLGSKLHLTNSPVVDNSGTYQCVASNSLGQASEAFHVTHNGRSCYGEAGRFLNGYMMTEYEL